MVIDRCEQKYFISNEKYNKLINIISNKIEKDKYFKERIYNIYFDNDNMDLINKSMDKPIYKEKIRLRSYEIPNDDSIVFLEIKKKYKSNSNKRRIEINYKDALNYMYNGILPINSQIMNEIDYCFKKYNLKPKISITYDRPAYYLKVDNNVRLTFDSNVKYDLNNIVLNDIKNNNILFKSGYIMEIKTFNGLPRWLIDVFDKLNIYPTSYSKIGKIYTNLNRNLVLN